jgi:hypothetical protein
VKYECVFPKKVINEKKNNCRKEVQNSKTPLKKSDRPTKKETERGETEEKRLVVFLLLLLFLLSTRIKRQKITDCCRHTCRNTLPNVSRSAERARVDEKYTDANAAKGERRYDGRVS